MSINKRQNEVECLGLLYGQRLLYDKARTCWIFYLIILIISLAVSFYLAQKYEDAAATITGILLLINGGIAWMANYHHNLGADFQAEFDCRVFDFGNCRLQLLMKKIELEHELTIGKKKKIFVLNHKHLSEKSLKNWYSDVSIVKHNETAVFLCQLESISWSTRLAKKFIYFCYGLLSIVFILTLLFFNTLEVGYIFSLILTSPLILFFVGFLKKLIIYYLSLKKVMIAEKLFDSLIAEKDYYISKNDVDNLQVYIDTLRKNSLLIPNFFYWIYRKDDQALSCELQANRIEKIRKSRPELLIDNSPRFFEA